MCIDEIIITCMIGSFYIKVLDVCMVIGVSWKDKHSYVEAEAIVGKLG